MIETSTDQVISFITELLAAEQTVEATLTVFDREDGTSDVVLKLSGLHGPLVGTDKMELLPVQAAVDDRLDDLAERIRRA